MVREKGIMFSIVVSRELKDKLKQIAKEKKISVSSLVNSILYDYFNKIESSNKKESSLDKLIEVLEKKLKR